MKVKQLLLSLFAVLTAMTAWADVRINATNFPDKNFRYWVSNRMYGFDGWLTDAEIESVTTIDVSDYGIQSLQGIEYFTALKELDCSRNQLKTLDVLGCTALRRLWCQQNQLTILDVSQNTALIGLICHENQLTAIDVSGCTALDYLSCHDNQLTAIDVSKNTALLYLYCYWNQLTALNVSKNTALTYLYCDNNQLTELDVSKNTALEDLFCDGNQLTTLDVSKNTALTRLGCGNNQLTALDVSQNTMLTSLDCHDNQLTLLDVSQNNALMSLDCYQNQIKNEGMDVLVESLPTVSRGSMYVIYKKDEQNKMTIAQVAAAKTKGWTPYYCVIWSWMEYEGDPDGIRAPHVEMDNEAIYNLAGQRLQKMQKGINIVGGKKNLIK